MTAFDKNSVVSVAELNRAARQLIETGLPLLWVRGEVSNFVSAASGHWYFSLKDEQAQVRCVMFRHKNQYLDFLPANGMQIEVRALASLYEARGDFQLTLENMRPAGQGALFEAFERLKLKLEGEGLFEAARKRALPFLPRQIGIITSPQAAALRDVLRTLAQRMPNVPIVLYPVPVQGADAAPRIAQAIATANRRAECDVLILCRGGGSIEDLWAFNEEVVARAITASALPLVSGVGHETDFTIADFVADLRAATPTAAAQAVVPEREALRRHLVQQQRHLARAVLRRFEQYMQRLDYLQRGLLHPAQRMGQQGEQLCALLRRMRLAQSAGLQRAQWRSQAVRQRLVAAMANRLGREDARLRTLHQHLQHLDPQQVLARGYSLVRDAAGNIVRRSATVGAGDSLQLTFAEGGANVEVRETWS